MLPGVGVLAAGVGSAVWELSRAAAVADGVLDALAPVDRACLEKDRPEHLNETIPGLLPCTA